MRHLVKMHASGYSQAESGGTVAELGPGDSLGIGLAAMLSGFDRYFALDVKKHANADGNLAVFRELLRLFVERAPVPGDEEFPLVFPRLDSYSFPHGILTEELLRSALNSQRVDAIARAIPGSGHAQSEAIRIDYVVPWSEMSFAHRESVDFAFSQAVLEHVEDTTAAYKAIYHCLRPGGFMSNTIDYESHGLTHDWFGHWTIGDVSWRLVRGARPYLINRLPHSAHVRAIEGAGFRMIQEEARQGTPPRRAQLADRFSELSDADLETCGAYVQAVKPAEHAAS
jgi:SAM-dependent methyltransferase